MHRAVRRRANEVIIARQRMHFNVKERISLRCGRMICEVNPQLALKLDRGNVIMQESVAILVEVANAVCDFPIVPKAIALDNDDPSIGQFEVRVW